MVTLQVVVTEKCNLGCSYCYMKNRNTYITKEVFMKFYEDLPSNQEYAIDFFGGEPLLNWNMVKFITETVSSDPRFKALYMPSNGLLLSPRKVNFILEHGIKFQWSCDGVKEKNIQDYINISDLLSQVCDTVSVVSNPNNLDFIENHIFFEEFFGMTAKFRLIREGWDEESVQKYKTNYSKYVDYLIEEFKTNRIDVPEHIIHDINMLFEGTKTDKPRKRCIDSERICLMPDGTQGFCARKCTDGDMELPHDYNELYEVCRDCDMENFCEKGCYDMVQKHGIDSNLCELYRFTMNESIRFNHELKNDVYWTSKYIRKMFDDYKDNI